MGKSGGRRSSISSLKGQTAVLGLEDTFSPGKEKDWKGKKGKKEKKGGGRLHYERCAHCQELYSEVIQKIFFLNFIKHFPLCNVMNFNNIFMGFLIVILGKINV